MLKRIDELLREIETTLSCAHHSIVTAGLDDCLRRVEKHQSEIAVLKLEARAKIHEGSTPR
jgi:hypothetical protein